MGKVMRLDQVKGLIPSTIFSWDLYSGSHEGNPPPVLTREINNTDAQDKWCSLVVCRTFIDYSLACLDDGRYFQNQKHEYVEMLTEPSRIKSSAKLI